jgi:prepilin-type N-terminal cleavage/methylation domain-containing protein
MFYRCASVRQGNATHPTGFTLVEMLVSLTIFGLAVSALVVALHVGGRTWRNVRASQARQGEIEAAFEVFKGDIAQLRLPAEGDESPPLTEADDGEGGERLSFATFNRGRAGGGTPAYLWAGVEYGTEGGEQGGLDLVRTTLPRVAGVAGERFERIVLKGVRGVSFSYLTKEGTKETYEEGALPAGVVMALRLTEGEPLRCVATFPLGLLGAG